MLFCISGVFILNLVCRSEDLRKEIKTKLKKIFCCVSSYKLEQDVNEVLFCSTTAVQNNDAVRNQIKAAAQNFNSIVKENKIQSRNIVDVTDLVKKLSIL